MAVQCPRRELQPSAVIAAVLLSALDSHDDNTAAVEIEDLSRRLTTLQEKGVDLSDFALSPGGYYSQDIVAYVGDLLALGFATKRSPVRLTNTGLELCRQTFQESLNDARQQRDAKRVAEILGVAIP